MGKYLLFIVSHYVFFLLQKQKQCWLCFFCSCLSLQDEDLSRQEVWGEREGDQRNDSPSNCKKEKNIPYALREEKCEPVRSETV